MALVAGAAICAAVAAFVPLRDVVEYNDFRVLGGGGIAVVVGGEQVFVQAPPGWVISGWGTDDDGSATIVFGRADRASSGSVTLLLGAGGSMEFRGAPDDVEAVQAGLQIMRRGTDLRPPPSIAPAPLP